MKPSRADVAIDGRLTSHLSAGMRAYVRRLIALAPLAAPDLAFTVVGRGDNFDWAEQVGLPYALARTRPRLAHFPSPFVPFIVPVPYVVTVHDLIDLHYPQFGKRRVGPYYRFGVAPVLRRARAVITDDERTIADLERFLGVDPRRVRVISLGVDVPDRLPPPVVRERPYLLYAGNHRGHKNLATLARAWSELPPEDEADLLLTGRDDVGAAFAPFTRRRGTIVFVGDRSDDELLALYRGAAAYVHPALREGFGLPLLEAMRAGTPVIASRTSLPAVLAPYAAAFEPHDVARLGELLHAALRNPEPMRRTALAAQTATRGLTWDATVNATVRLYRELLA